MISAISSEVVETFFSLGLKFTFDRSDVVARDDDNWHVVQSHFAACLVELSKLN